MLWKKMLEKTKYALYTGLFSFALKQTIERKHSLCLILHIYKTYQEVQKKLFCIKTIFILGIMDLKKKKMHFAFELF